MDPIEPIEGAETAAPAEPTPSPAEPSIRDSLAEAFSGASEGTPAEPAPDAAQPQDRQRDEAGRFVPQQDGAQPEVPKQDAAQPPAEPAAPETPQDAATEPKADAIVPPPGWSPSAKAEFAKLPDSVKQAVATRETEINQGFAKLQEYKPLDPFIEMARTNGTTLDVALQNYVRAEQLLESDAVSGILWLCQTYNVDPSALIQAGQAGQQAPQSAAQQTGQQTGQQPVPQIDLSPITHELEQLRNMVVGERTQKTRTEIDAFFADTAGHPYADNVADQMAEYFRAGVASDLQQAYDMACWNNPEIRELLIKKQRDDEAAALAAENKRKVDQARTAGSSITGGVGQPAAGDASSGNLRADLEAHFAGARA